MITADHVDYIRPYDEANIKGVRLVIIIFVGGVICMFFTELETILIVEEQQVYDVCIQVYDLNQFFFLSLSLAVLETTVRKIEIVSETVHSSKTEAMDI